MYFPNFIFKDTICSCLRFHFIKKLKHAEKYTFRYASSESMVYEPSCRLPPWTWQQGLEHEMIKNILKRSRQEPPKRSTCEHSLSCYMYSPNLQINVERGTDIYVSLNRITDAGTQFFFSGSSVTWVVIKIKNVMINLDHVFILWCCWNT